MANDKREQARNKAKQDALNAATASDCDRGDCAVNILLAAEFGFDAGLAAATAEGIPQSDGWVDVAVSLPPAKEGWNHSEQCLVWYQPSLDAVGNYGIAYYHYDPPYRPCEWVDFAHLGRDPIAWQPLPTPYQRPSREGDSNER